MKLYLLPLLSLAVAPALAAKGYCSTTTTINKNIQSGDYVYVYHVDYPAISVSGKISTDCIMNTGAEGSGVRSLQTALNECYGKSLDVDGDYGAKTKAAVKSMQGKIGASADGIWGSETGSLMKFYASSSGGGYKCVQAGTSV
ncbi:hypothetical protein GQ53DRAFT_359564 [Thozetella sp. PMI_491]|nr:hypothetical protein GQ53DRAFT_359564 [Thozetella sp. PMI_491]